MGAFVSVTLNSQPLARFFTNVKRPLPVALARALNRTATSERAAMGTAIAKDMGLKVGTVKAAIMLVKATAKRLVARLSTTGSRIPLIDFKARGQEPSRGRGRGVSYRLPGSARSRAPNAFIATMRSGHRGVFERVPGGKRHGPRPMRAQLPIFELFGPSIATVFSKLAPVGEARRNEVLLKNVQAEVNYALSQGT